MNKTIEYTKKEIADKQAKIMKKISNYLSDLIEESRIPSSMVTSVIDTTLSQLLAMHICFVEDNYFNKSLEALYIFTEVTRNMIEEICKSQIEDKELITR